MLKLLQWLIFGHVHDWKLVGDGRVFDPIDIDFDHDSLPVGKAYEYECRKCGRRRFEKQ